MPVQPGMHLQLGTQDAHHLVRVVRRRPGDQVEVVDDHGRLWPATVADDGGQALLRVGAAPRPAPPPAPVVLYVGLAEWGRIDTVAEKASELGVTRLTLMSSERVRRHPEPDSWRRRRERLMRVAEAAARQAGQGHLVEIDGIVPFEQAVSDTGGDGVLVDPRGTLPLAAALEGRVHDEARLAVIVGPDTGFTDAELTVARDAGLDICTLGAATLRTETAALVAMTLALQASGHLDLSSEQHDASE